MSASENLDELTAALIARLRGHGHLCNVLTHIGSGNWRTIEQAIGAILQPRVRVERLTPVARNVVELVSDGRGVTGPIMRSVFFDAAAAAAGVHAMKLLKRRIARLRDRLDRPARRRSEQAAAAPGQGPGRQPTNVDGSGSVPLGVAA